MKISNKTLFSIHGWSGLNLGFLLFVICLSGTVATLSYEWDWLLDEDIRPVVPPDDSARKIPLAEVYDLVQSRYPHGVISVIREAPERYLATQVFLKDNDLGNVSVYVDPYASRILAVRDRLNIKNFFRIFHKQLFILPTRFTFNGVLITGLFGFSLLLTVLAGFILLGSRLKNLLRLRVRKGLRVFLSDWHRSTGLWALLFSVLFASTGIWYWLEKATSISEVELVQDNQVQYRNRGPVLPPPDVNRYVESAVSAIPGLDVKALLFSTEAGAPVHVFGQAEAVLVRDAANYVALDPYSGDVLSVRDATDLGALDRWLHTVDPVHFGNFGGLWAKLIWFFFGFLLTVSIPVGMFLWFKRVSLRADGAASRIGPVGVAVNVLGVFILVVSTAFSVYGIQRMQSGRDATHAVDFGRQRLGDWTVSLQQRVNEHTGDASSFSLRFGELRPNPKAAYLLIQSADGGSAELEFSRQWRARRATWDKAVALHNGPGLKQALTAWYRKIDSVAVTVVDQRDERHRYVLSKETIIGAVGDLEPLPPRVESHTPAVLLITGFLIFIWLSLFAWAASYIRIYRRLKSPVAAGTGAEPAGKRESPRSRTALEYQNS